MTEWVEADWALSVAGVCATIGIIFALYNITMHLIYWRQPMFQLWIVRVLLIVPIYATISWLSLEEPSARIYLEICRDCYESFVIYCFLIWILNAIGGSEACGASIAKKMYLKHPWPMCCLPHIRLNASFLRVCKRRVCAPFFFFRARASPLF